MSDVYTKELLSLTPIDFTGLTAVANANIAVGNDLFGSGAALLSDTYKMRVRNKMGRTILAFQNTHATLQAYATVVTQRSYYSLGLADLELILPNDSKVYVIGGMTTIFNTSGTETIITNGAEVTRSYSDYMWIRFAHDASNPAGTLRFGAFYL